MSVIDEALQANNLFALTFSHRFLSSEPARKLAIVACMDVRTPIELLLGLRVGDAHIIRNAGGIVTEDVLRSLLVSRHFKGVQEIMIINHTDCGMMKLNDEEMRTRIQQSAGKAADAPRQFYTFTDLETNIRAQVQKIKAHPWFGSDFPARGFIYDVATGRLTEVM